MPAHSRCGSTHHLWANLLSRKAERTLGGARRRTPPGMRAMILPVIGPQALERLWWPQCLARDSGRLRNSHKFAGSPFSMSKTTSWLGGSSRKTRSIWLSHHAIGGPGAWSCRVAQSIPSSARSTTRQAVSTPALRSGTPAYRRAARRGSAAKVSCQVTAGPADCAGFARIGGIIAAFGPLSENPSPLERHRAPVFSPEVSQCLSLPERTRCKRSWPRQTAHHRCCMMSSHAQ